MSTSPAGPFFRFLTDILTLGLNASQKRAVPLLIGAGLYTGVIGLLILSLVWLDDSVTVVAAWLAVLLLAIMIMLLVIGPTLHAAFRNGLAAVTILGLLATLVFGAVASVTALVGNAPSEGDLLVPVTGDVRYSDTRAASGISVRVPGTGIQQPTNPNGSFSFSVPRDAVTRDSILLELRLTRPDTTIDVWHRLSGSSRPIVLPVPSPGDGGNGEDGGGVGGNAMGEEAASAVRVGMEQARDALSRKRFAQALQIAESTEGAVPEAMRGRPAVDLALRELGRLENSAADSLRKVRALRDSIDGASHATVSAARTHLDNRLYCLALAHLDPIARRASEAKTLYPDYGSDPAGVAAVTRLRTEVRDAMAHLLRQGYECDRPG